MVLGKRAFEIATKWIPSATVYGGVGGLAFLYFSDWRVIVDFIPIYNGKFKDSK